MNTVDELLHRALELPMNEWEDLAHKLLLSLQPDSPDADWESAWGEEVERRLEQLDRGEVTSRDAWESLAELRESLHEKSER